MQILSAKAAILLEIVSFFLVTIDLFGRDRLDKLHRQFEVSIAGLKDRDLKIAWGRWFTPDPSVKDSDFMWGLTAVSLLVLSICGGEYLLWSKGGLWLVLPVVGGVIVSFVGTVVLMSLFYWVIVFIEKLVDGIFSMLMLLFSKFKLDGAMLGVGSIVFVASKVISWLTTP